MGLILLGFVGHLWVLFWRWWVIGSEAGVAFFGLLVVEPTHASVVPSAKNLLDHLMPWWSVFTYGLDGSA